MNNTDVSPVNAIDIHTGIYSVTKYSYKHLHIMYKFLTIILVIWSAIRLLCCNHYDYTHTPGSSNTSKCKKKCGG